MSHPPAITQRWKAPKIPASVSDAPTGWWGSASNARRAHVVAWAKGVEHFSLDARGAWVKKNHASIDDFINTHRVEKGPRAGRNMTAGTKANHFWTLAMVLENAKAPKRSVEMYKNRSRTLSDLEQFKRGQ